MLVLPFIIKAMAQRRKNPHAVALGRRRMRNLTEEERKEFAILGGKASSKARFEGLTKEEISAKMLWLRALGARKNLSVEIRATRGEKEERSAFGKKVYAAPPEDERVKFPARGGKAAWSGLSLERRSVEMKRRPKVRARKKRT